LTRDIKDVDEIGATNANALEEDNRDTTVSASVVVRIVFDVSLLISLALVDTVSDSSCYYYYAVTTVVTQVNQLLPCFLLSVLLGRR